MRSALLGPSGADPGEESLEVESLSSELLLSLSSPALAMPLAAFLAAFRASRAVFFSSSLVSLSLEDDELDDGGSFFLLGSFFVSLRPEDVAFAAMPLDWYAPCAAPSAAPAAEDSSSSDGPESGIG